MLRYFLPAGFRHPRWSEEPTSPLESLLKPRLQWFALLNAVLHVALQIGMQAGQSLSVKTVALAAHRPLNKFDADKMNGIGKAMIGRLNR
jgi:hypothetical protein